VGDGKREITKTPILLVVTFYELFLHILKNKLAIAAKCLNLKIVSHNYPSVTFLFSSQVNNFKFYALRKKNPVSCLLAFNALMILQDYE
jgi:hypothetical protein